MVFSSFNFLIKFLPAFLVVYYVAPRGWRNAVLLAGSLAFYAVGAWETPLYILLLAISVIVNWFFAPMLYPDNKDYRITPETTRKQIAKMKKKRKGTLIFLLVFNLGLLFIFKYTYFLKISPFKFVLPIGISFYTFQSLSYIIDVYKGTVMPDESIIRMGAYITMFPQLIAGPIVKYSSIREQLRERAYSKKMFFDGLMYFALGLGSKVVIANQIGCLWNDVRTVGFDSISVPLAWLGIAAYALQLYFDFYGYSLMAIGLGKMIGFELPENFNCPYCAISVSDFWRRWHITLSSWFKEYVYIPMGGNRRGKGKQIFNLFVVWMLTGIWHGAGLNFVLWGFILFVLIAAEKLGLENVFNKVPVLGHIYTCLAMVLSWAVFAIEDFADMKIFFGRLVGLGGENIAAGDFAKIISEYAIVLIVGVFCCTDIPKKAFYKFKDKWYVWIVCALSFGAAMYCLYMGMDDPFLYFRF